MLLAIQCVRHAFSVNREYYRSDSSPVEFRKLVRIMNQIFTAYKGRKPKGGLADLAAVVFEMSDDSGGAGWPQILNAVYEILYFHKRKALAHRYAAGAVQNSYQAVAGVTLNVLMLELGRGFSGEESEAAENGLLACLQEVNFQKALIDQLLRGEKLVLK